jgi:hypothetical protein
MRLISLCITAAAGVLSAAPASAAELFVGLHKHAVNSPLSLGGGLERGVDVSVGYRLDRIGKTPLQPYVFGSLNSAGDTSFAAAGLSARFGRRIYIRPALGLAIHNGSTGQFTEEDRVAFGSRILFDSELAVGAQINDRLSVEASLIHLSHGQIFSRQNPGIDNVGARLNFAF